MGNYLNPDISTFARVVNSEIYVERERRTSEKRIT